MERLKVDVTIKGQCYEDMVSILSTNGYRVEVTTEAYQGINYGQYKHRIRAWEERPELEEVEVELPF